MIPAEYADQSCEQGYKFDAEAGGLLRALRKLIAQWMSGFFKLFTPVEWHSIG